MNMREYRQLVWDGDRDIGRRTVPSRTIDVVQVKAALATNDPKAVKPYRR
jgi:hypothetical protein